MKLAKRVQLMRAFKNCLIVISMTIVLLVALEIIVRFYLFAKTRNKAYLTFCPAVEQKAEFSMPKIKEYDTYFKFEPGIYRMKAGAAASDVVEYAINSKGFRGPEFSSRKEPDTTRIFCFGGSSTLGPNLNFKETYPYYLQQNLDKKFAGKKFEVINAGVMAYTMQRINSLFKEEVINYDPDIITVYAAYNDATYTRNRIYVKTNLFLRICRLLYYRWMLFTVLTEKVSLIKNKIPAPFFFCTPNSVEIYVKNLECLILLAKQKNIKVILIKQPINVDIEIDFNKETIESLKEKVKKATSIKEMRIYTQYLLVKEMERIGFEHKLAIVNPLDEFKRNKEEYFLDDVHLTAKGNRKLAEIIAKSLNE